MKREQVKEIAKQLCEENGLQSEKKADVLSEALYMYDLLTMHDVVDENAATLAAIDKAIELILKP